jgi:hypothetical protein
MQSPLPRLNFATEVYPMQRSQSNKFLTGVIAADVLAALQSALEFFDGAAFSAYSFPFPGERCAYTLTV